MSLLRTPLGRPDRPSRARPRALVALGVLAGAAGSATALACLSTATRHLMRTTGGSCASGGPYAVAAEHACAADQVWLLVASVFALLIFGGLFAFSIGVGAVGGGSWSGMDASLLLWSALFGVLGYDFLTLGFDPPEGVPGSGWIVTGAVFAAMALGGLVPLLWSVQELIRRRGAAEPPLVSGTLVRARVDPNASAPAPPQPVSPALLPKRLTIPKRDWDEP